MLTCWEKKWIALFKNIHASLFILYLELLFAKKTWSFGGGFVAQFSVVFFAQSPYHMTYNYK